MTRIANSTPNRTRTDREGPSAPAGSTRPPAARSEPAPAQPPINLLLRVSSTGAHFQRPAPPTVNTRRCGCAGAVLNDVVVTTSFAITSLSAESQMTISTKTRSWPPRRSGASGTGLPSARNLLAVRLEGIQIGDIVEVDRLGRRFHALVTGNAGGHLSIQPLDRRVTYRSCRAHEAMAHWAKRGRPRATSEPLEPSPLQLEFDTTVRD